jgi:hypothetical protein
MLRGVQCLLLTSYVALALQQASHSANNSEPRPSGAASGTAVGSLLLLVNVVYVCSLLWQLM